VLTQEMGDDLNTAIWMMNSGQTSMYLGRWEEAERLAQAAVDLCRTLGNSRFLPGAIVHQAEIYFEQAKYEQAQLVLTEALALSEAVADQLLWFDGRLLQVRLWYQFGDKDRAVNTLHTMLTDFAGDEYQAQLYYYLWQMAGEEALRATAVPLYEKLLAQTPNYKLQQQLKALLDDQ